MISNELLAIFLQDWIRQRKMIVGSQFWWFEMLESGMRGHMTDFGEELPIDA